MLHETASNTPYPPPLPEIDDEAVTTTTPDTLQPLRDLVAEYMTIEHENATVFEDLGNEDQAIILRADGEPVVTFSGFLKQEPSQAYNALNKALQPSNCYALFRQNTLSSDTPHIIQIIEGRLPQSQPHRSLLNVILFLLTIAAVFFTGAQQAVAELTLADPSDGEFTAYFLTVTANIWRGYPYALSIMAILIAHELGHYLMMRRHGLQATLPFFIPAPLLTPFGTFGAAILLDDVVKDRKVLLDIGAAGPIAGFIVSVPLVIYGLSTSTIVPLDTSGYLEGNSLMYLFAKIIALGQIYPTSELDVFLNQVAFAGWTGLLLTCMQMIPVGQLDGGHVLYALLGERARWAFLPVMLGFVGITIFTGQTIWVAFLLLLLFIGRFYAVPLDTITPLDMPRQIIAILALVIFVLTFVPLPFVRAEDSMLAGDSAGLLFIVGLLLMPQVCRRWLR